MAKQKEHQTITLAIAMLIVLPAAWLLYYAWLQLGINLPGQINTINLFYVVIGLIMWIAGIFASYLKHQFAGIFLSGLGVCLILIVLIYYTWMI